MLRGWNRLLMGSLEREIEYDQCFLSLDRVHIDVGIEVVK